MYTRQKSFYARMYSNLFKTPPRPDEVNPPNITPIIRKLTIEIFILRNYPRIKITNYNQSGFRSLQENKYFNINYF